MTRRKTCHRYNTPGDGHELTFTCFRKRRFLSRDRTRQYLIAAILKAKAKHDFHIWAYAFMPEHVHLLIWPTLPEYDTSKILETIKKSVARRAVCYLRKHNPDGLRWLATGQRHRPYRFWMAGGGYDRNIITPPALRNMAVYIHHNPVRRGLVAVAEDWPWSSAREWEEPGAGPIPIDRESFPPIQGPPGYPLG